MNVAAKNNFLDKKLTKYIQGGPGHRWRLATGGVAGGGKILSLSGVAWLVAAKFSNSVAWRGWWPQNFEPLVAWRGWRSPPAQALDWIQG